jgi:Thioesterase superfamily
MTLMPNDAEVLTVELKVNLLSPASGGRLVAEGEVLRAGRTVTVCRGDAYERETERVHVATMLATMVRRRAGRTESAGTSELAWPKCLSRVARPRDPCCRFRSPSASTTSNAPSWSETRPEWSARCRPCGTS